MENNQQHQAGNTDIKQNVMAPMPKKSSKGPIVAIVILIILAIAAVAGTWYYMDSKAKSEKKAQEAQVQELQKQIDEFKGQATANTSKVQTKSYTTKYDKLRFNYPENWTVTDKSEASTAEIISTYGIEGVDIVSVKSPDGFEIYIMSGGMGGFACPAGSVNLATSERINLLGENYFLNYRKKDGTNYVEDIYVATKADQCQSDLSSKSRKSKEDGRGLWLRVGGGYGENRAKTYEQLLGDPNLRAYKNFLQSLSY